MNSFFFTVKRSWTKWVLIAFATSEKREIRETIDFKHTKINMRTYAKHLVTMESMYEKLQ